MSQTNNNESGVGKAFSDEGRDRSKIGKAKVLPIYLSLNVDMPEKYDQAKKREYAKICSEIVAKIFCAIHKATLAPGKFETPYDFTLDFNDAVTNKNVDVKFSLLSSSGFEANGLTCRYENGVLSISGTPKNPKGFDGNVQFVLDGSFYALKELWGNYFLPVNSCFKNIKINRKFVLNPDPDTLWEDNPTPNDAPFQKPNEAVQSATTPTEPPLTVLGASQRGRSHAQVGSFRDDHFTIRLGANPDDWHFVAVADGAGSARFSREGSRLACETCINDPQSGLAALFQSRQKELDDEINSFLDVASGASEVDFSAKLPQTLFEKIFCTSVYYAGIAIANASKDANAKLGDFNTTLLCAAFKRIPKTEQTPARWIVLSYWVGDGGLAIYRPNGTQGVLALGTPDGGEFAGQTRFLTMSSELTQEAICKRLRLAVVEDFQALVLASDGITDPFFPAEANLSDNAYWEKFWNETLPKEFPGALDATKSLEDRGKALLDGLKFKSKGNHDDRTLVLVLNDAFGQERDVKDEASSINENTGVDRDSDAAAETTRPDEFRSERCGVTDDGETDFVLASEEEELALAPCVSGETTSQSFDSACDATENAASTSEASVATPVSSVEESETEVEKALETTNTEETSAFSVLDKVDAPERRSETQVVKSPVSVENSAEELAPPPSEIVLSTSTEPTNDETSRSPS